MEACCETHPGTFCFNRPIYDEQTAPGVLRIRFAKGWRRIVDGAFCKPLKAALVHVIEIHGGGLLIHPDLFAQTDFRLFC